MIFILLILGILSIENCSATKFLQDEQTSDNLRNRKKAEFKQYVSLTTDEKNSYETTQNTDLLESIISKDEIFSCLGNTWENFKNRDFDLYFSPLNYSQSEKSPEALYLMGIIHEKGLGKIHKSLKQTIHWYTLSLAYAEKTSPLYCLALEALQRCIKQSDPSKLSY